jgi:DNA-binding response OmpR family regulator
MAKILVCEDDNLLARIIEKILISEKHEVTLVKDGSLAIREFNNFNFRLVISDMNMPGISGLGLIDFIRNTRNCKVPILIISGLSNADQIREVKKRGANDFLPKPFAVERLKRKVSQLLTNYEKMGYCSA